MMRLKRWVRKCKIVYNFNLSNLSTYRQEMMGLSIAMVLLCHARMNGAALPSLILSLLSLGNWGVDIFFLLSGVGIYYSLQKCDNQGTSLRSWYLKRFKRILIPYLVLETPYWLWYTIHSGKEFLDFIYYISMVSFWRDGIGLWFLAFLIPLYLAAPFLYQLFAKKRGIFYLSSLVCLCLLSPLITPPYLINKTIDITLFYLPRISLFLIGLGLGDRVLKGKKLNCLFILGLLLVSHFFAISSAVYKGWLWAILIVVLYTKIKECFSLKMKFFSILGQYTLELYIGLDLSSYILSYFLPSGTAYWLGTIVGSCLLTMSYVYLKIEFLKRKKLCGL